jgi:hypothetical protein
VVQTKCFQRRDSELLIGDFGSPGGIDLIKVMLAELIGVKVESRHALALCESLTVKNVAKVIPCRESPYEVTWVGLIIQESVVDHIISAALKNFVKEDELQIVRNF